MRSVCYVQVPIIDMAWPDERCVEVMKAACLRTGFFYGARPDPADLLA